MSIRAYDFKHTDNESDGFEIVKVGDRLRLYSIIGAGNYSNMNSDAIRDLRNFLTGWLQSEGYEEAPATSDTPSQTDVWPPLPDGVTGTQVRCRQFAVGVRLGGAEPKVLVAETENYVIFKIWSSNHEDLGERVLTKVEFDDKFERRGDERVGRIRAFQDSLNALTHQTGLALTTSVDQELILVDSVTSKFVATLADFTQKDGYEVEMMGRD